MLHGIIAAWVKCIVAELENVLPDFFEDWYYGSRSGEWANARELENLLNSVQKRCPDKILKLEMIPQELQKYTTHHAEKEPDFGGAVLRLLLEYTDPGKKKPICFICAGYKQHMQMFLQKNAGLQRRFKVILFDNYSVNELMEILEKQLAKEGYQVEPAYMNAARENFKTHIKLIQEQYNGGYVSEYVRRVGI